MSVFSMKWEINWKRLLSMVGVILGVVLILLWISWKPPTPGVREMGDLIKIKKALEEYHQKYGKYPQSHNMPSTIREFLPEVPRAKKGKTYKWMDNTDDEQKFCIWTELNRHAYFLVSPCGEGGSGHLPATLDECCEFSKPK